MVSKQASTGICLAAAAVFILPASDAHSAVIVPISATASSRLFNDTRDDPANLINGNGFIVTTPIQNSTHTNADWGSGAANWGWFGGQSPGPSIDFVLGGTFDVGFAHVWNWNGASDTQNWGIAGFNLIFSRDAAFGNGDDTIRSFTIAAASGLSSYTGEHYSFASENDVTHIRLLVTANLPAGNDFAGLSEVRFSEAIPEPSTFAFLVAGCSYLFKRRRNPVGG